MPQDHKTIWNNCLNFIRQEVSEQSYETWFAPISSCKYEGNVLTIRVPNQFFYEWLEGHYVSLLRKVIHSEIGPQGSLSYQVASSAKPAKVKKEVRPKRGAPIPLNLNPNFVFENFIVGDCNQLAQAAAENIANNPGHTAFNPFMIHGSTGLGKTHIVQAVAHTIKTNHSEKEIIYTTTEKFTSQFIQAIRSNSAQDFVSSYLHCDVLIVDDIQFLGGKEKTQEIFFYIFNQLHQSNKQVIITSDCAPSDLQGFEKRLLSRFKWGLTVDLHPPDLETRIAIIQSKLNRNNFDLSDELIHYVASKVTTNIREIEGVLISLVAHADFRKEKVNKELVGQIIASVVGETKLPETITLKYLQKIVAAYYKLSPEQLKAKSRKREIVVPRQLVMYLARKYTNHSLKMIGNALGRKDHSTVNYALKTIRNSMKNSKAFRQQVGEIERMIEKETA